MKKGMGKQKGSSFERQVCWILSRFVEPDTNETLFWRSAMSGGRATVQSKRGIKNKAQAGDITCIDQRGEWLIPTLFIAECKFYKDLNIDSSLVLKKGNLWKFWRQLRKLAKKQDREPLLIAKQNRFPALAILSSRGVTKLSTFGTSVPTPKIVSHGMHIFLFEELFNGKT